VRQPDAIVSAEQGKIRGRLFRKYVALFVAVVCVALLANGLLEVWFSYQEHKASLVRIQREQAQESIAQQQDPIFASPRDVFLELVLSIHELEAAAAKMRKAWWPPP
jgi:hypothetical protein